jgi:hypothetical protein
METKTQAAKHNLGTFDGYNLEHDKAIINLSTQDLICYDHDLHGESEFWPSGDNIGLQLVIKGNSKTTSHVTGSELLEIDRILSELNGDSLDNYAKIYSAINSGWSLRSLTGDIINDLQIYIFIGDSFRELTNDAAWQLFELVNHELCNLVATHPVDGLEFNCKRFLNSPSISSEEIKLGEFMVLIVTFN